MRASLISPRRKWSLSAAVIAALGLLAACGSSDAATSASTTTVGAVGDPAATLAADPAATPALTPALTTAPTTAPTTDETTGFGSCATGEWLVLADQVARIFDNSPLRSLPGFAVSVEGEGHLDLRADGTYTYVPDFTANITVNDITGTGSWTGTLEGTWSIVGDQLTMAQTQNDLAGSVTIMGTPTPMPALNDFNGSATVTDCQPMTFSYRMDTPMGAVDHTLVLDG
ncbi:MAG: hypothetical protein WCC60_05730 [Ilumatobacteraceae bacterium]